MSELSRQELLQALTTSQQEVVTLLESMAERQDWQPEPAEWSFRMLAAHLAAVERSCHLARIQGIAGGGTPQLRLYSTTAPDLAMDLRDSLRLWKAARGQLLDFVRRLSDRQLAYVGVHEQVGPLTVLDMLEELLEQDHGNLRHVRQLIAAFYEEQFPPLPVTCEAL